MSETLRPKDYRFIVICVLICAASLYVGIRYFYRAFPEASIDFKVTRESSLPLAERFLASRQVKTAQYRHASAFRYDDEAKVFLERELGLEKANKVMASEVKLWRWAHRWYRPLQKEEVRVEVTTRGEIASFRHVLREEAPGTDLEPEAARSLAVSFLVLQTGRPIDSLDYVDSQTQKRPHRTDHVFTWKVVGQEYRNASYRVSVTVQGDRVDGYSEYLKIPEEWSRNYTRLRSLNESTTQVDLFFFALLGVGMILTLGRRVRLKDVRWSAALTFGGISMVLQVLASLNAFPLAEYGFDTASSYSSFIGGTVLSALLGGLTLGGVILLLTACAEPVYRQAYPDHISIPRMFGWQSIRTRSFLIACLAGTTLTFFFFAYEIGFYLLAQQLGAWAPADLPYTDLLNTRFPWIFVLLSGFFPAISEEWMFRAFSIPFLNTLLRRRWPAIVLASFIWGFGHANYPNQPFFIRGIEVGIVGIILSWAMLRFGILVPLVTHYSVDAFYAAFLLIRSGNSYLVATGAVTAGINLVPLLLAASAYVVTRRFQDERDVSNERAGTARSVPEEKPRAEPETLPPYTRLSAKARYAGIALLALGALLAWFRPPRFTDSVRFRCSMTQAEDGASRFLSNLGFELNDFKGATQPSVRVDATAVQYLYNAGGISRLNQVYRDLTVAVAWEVRFFKPLEKEEFRVSVDPASTKVAAFRHALAEETPGADLSQDEARRIAVSFLDGKGYDLSQYELKETSSEKPRQRRDTEFTWEARGGTPGAVRDARLRLRAGILGDKIGTWTHFVKIPEEWRRNRDRQNFYSIAVTAARILFIVSLFALAALTMIRATRLGHVNWRVAGKVAGIAAGAEALNYLNSIPRFLFQYDSRWDMTLFVLTGIVSAAMLVIGIALVAGLAAGLIIACYPEAPAVLKRERLVLWGRDALVGSVATIGAYLVLQGVSSQIQYRLSSLGLAPAISIPQNLGTYLPLISSLRDVFLSAILYSALLAFCVHLWSRLITRSWMRALLVVWLMASLLPASARRASEAGLDAASSVLLVVLAGWLVAAFFRNNCLAYVLAAATLAAARAFLSLRGHGNTPLEVQAWLLGAIILGGTLFLVLEGYPKAILTSDS